MRTLIGNGEIPSRRSPASSYCPWGDMTYANKPASPVLISGDVTNPTRLLTMATRMCRVGGFEYDVATQRLTWLTQAHNIFEEDEATPPGQSRLANFLSPPDYLRAMTQLGHTVETGEPTEGEFDAVTAKGRQLRIHVLREAEVEHGQVVRVIGAIRDITRETSMNRDLLLTNERLSDAFRIAGVRIWETDANLDHFQFISDATSTGDIIPAYTPASIVRYASEMMTADEWLRMKATCEQVLESGVPTSASWKITRPDIGVRWIETQIRRGTDEHGRHIVCGASRDVTEDVRSREELQRKTDEASAFAARFEALLGASNSLIYEMNADWTTLRHLRLGDHLIEAATEPRSGWLETYVPPDDWALVRQAFETAIRTKSPFELEHRAKTADGNIAWTHSRAIPVIGPQGEVTSWLGMAYPITERKRLEEARRESELRHRLLVEATSAVTWSCPPTGQHVYPQPQWMAFTGQSAEAMLGTGWIDTIHPDDRTAVGSEWEGSLRTGVPFRGEMRVRRHDGEWRWMSCTAVSVRDDEGVIREWFGMHIDITDRKHLELDLKQAVAAANSANSAKSTFVANMSHEIRTPMSTVIGMLEVLLRSPLEQSQYDHAAIALKSSRDLLHILNDVLDASAIEAGAVSVRSGPFRLRGLMADKLAMFGMRAEQKGLTLKVAIETDIPEWQLADVRRLRQVMNNLIGNALKYTEAGGIEITSSFDADRGMLRIAVADTGIGIDDKALERLFLPFTQIDPTLSRRYEGSGLGLSISRKLVELMGGKIGVSSRLGEGSTFWFEIPAPAVDAPEEITPSEQTESTIPPLRILVAEDNAAAQRIIEALLTAMGHTVTIVDNGAPAVAEVASGQYDLVLMDIMMPGMDGPTASRKIRELGGRAGGIPIIALTADILFGKDSGHLLAGMTDYVTKPIDVPLLVAALKRASGAEMASNGADDRMDAVVPFQ